MYRYLRYLLLLAIVGCNTTSPEWHNWLPAVPGHSHNDYLHDHPLYDALHFGLSSIEADVHKRGDQLMIAHTPLAIREGRTLQSLYLDPLRKIVTEYPDSIPHHFGQVILCIEMKSNFTTTFPLVKKILEGYKDILSVYENGVMHEKQVKVVLIDNYDHDIMEKESYRLYTTDGWAKDLGKFKNSNLVGISCLTINKDLKEQVAQAHRNGQRVRAWGDFDNQIAWQTLYDAGVDFINTDRLQEFNEFINSRRTKK